ncbi:hypothetical protein V8G54_035199 [Vigna mungo]|uniref:Bifunctional inhibitor/plant lipid transfer protein/seed storage helical domain-containing protein n=1 Tax=Vigna mungo TaxID=3915 RepID=A0AAQ3MEP2_VIGMU
MKPSIPSTVMMVTSKMGKRVFTDARMMLMMCGIVVMVMAMGKLPLISAQLECGNVFGVYMQCDRYIRREGATVPPSTQCCDALKDSNVTCMCPYFAEYEDTYSMEKVIYVLNYCGRPLASGTQCGSKFLILSCFFIYFLNKIKSRKTL